MFCLDERFSTTRCVTREKPEIINKPEDKFETLLFMPPGEGRQGEGGLRTKGYFKKSYEGKPLISVITVVFNDEKYLEETILSVLTQTYDNVEYIIIDGGSTDGTLETIKRYDHAIDYWVSEKDKGIYDGMNKGIDLASGAWINFINVGDGFYNNEILKVVFQNIGKFHGVIYGDTLIIYHKFQQKLKAYPFKNINFGMIFSHQSSFVSSFLYKSRKFSLNYKFAADYDFFYYLYKKGIDFIYIPQIFTYMRAGGASYVNYFTVISEYERIVIQNNNAFKNKLVFLYKKLKHIFRIIMIKLFPRAILEYIVNIKSK